MIPTDDLINALRDRLAELDSAARTDLARTVLMLFDERGIETQCILDHLGLDENPAEPWTYLDSARWNRTRQGHELVVLAKLDGVTLRATVYRDSYDFQSSAKIEAFDRQSTQWNLIATLGQSELACLQTRPSGVGRHRVPIINPVADLDSQGRHLMLADAQSLLEDATRILRGRAV